MCRRGPGELVDGLDDASLIIDVHDRDEEGVISHAVEHLSGVEPSASAGLEQLHLEAASGQVLQRLEDCLVLGDTGDDVSAPSQLAVMG